MKKVLTLAALLLCSIAAFSQSTTSNTSSTTTSATLSPAATQIIDGRTNPELIPDYRAYQLFMYAMGDLARNNQGQLPAGLHLAGLPAADHAQAVQIMIDYANAYDQILAQYNQAATQANAAGLAYDPKNLYTLRDALVQQTQTRLQNVLSANSVLALNNIVQTEKSKMTVGVE